MDEFILTTYRELNYNGIKFTMDDIAAQLGMSKKTIYKMFASKNDLVLTVVNAWIACAEEEENKILAESIPLQQKIANFLFLDVPGFEYPTLLFFRDITRHLPEVEKSLHNFSERRDKLLVNLLDESIEKKIIRPISTKYTADLLHNLYIVAIEREVPARHNMTLEESIRAGIELIMHGILIKE